MANELNKLLKSIHSAWDEVNAFLAALTDEQKTDLKDAGGWAIKDHVIHMAVWEDGIQALLIGDSRDARMGIDHITPRPKGDDAINAIIFQRHKDKSLAEVMQIRQQVHDRLLATLDSMRDEDMARPYSSFNTNSGNNAPIEGHIRGNTSGHYRKHLGWMKIIVGQE